MIKTQFVLRTSVCSALVSEIALTSLATAKIAVMTDAIEQVTRLAGTPIIAAVPHESRNCYICLTHPFKTFYLIGK